MAFQHAEHHKGVFHKYQEMVLEDAELDIPGLADAFKAKEQVAAAAEAAAAEAAKGEGMQERVALRQRADVLSIPSASVG